LLIAQPTGVCIHEFTLRIQKAENSVSTAAVSVATKCRPRPGLVATEQHHAEEARLEDEGGQRLVSHQRPITGPALSENTAQLVPNWQAITMPDTTLMRNTTATIGFQ